MSQKGIIKNSTSAECSAIDLASVFKSILGTSGILEIYDGLTCQKVNDNAVRLNSGVYNLSGYILEVSKDSTIELDIDSGTDGQNRRDLVVAEFERDGEDVGVDTLMFRIVKGTSTSGQPSDPELNTDDINAAGGILRQEALYRVNIVGAAITTIEQMATNYMNMSECFTGINYLGSMIQNHMNVPAPEVLAALGLSSTAAELNMLHNATGLVTADLVKLNALTATAAELNVLHNATGLVTADLVKLNALTATAAELNYVDGVTSVIQTQLDDLKDPDAGGALWKESTIVILGTTPQNVAGVFSVGITEGVFATKPDFAIANCASTAGIICNYRYDASTPTNLEFWFLKCDGALDTGGYRFSILAGNN